MTQINLLPWREAQREAQKREFVLLFCVAGIVGVLLTIAQHFWISRWITHQQYRTEFLQSEVIKVDAKIAVLRDIPKQKVFFTEQLKLLVDLHNNRFRTVHFLDEIVRVLPNEVYLTKITSTDKGIDLMGVAQNNAQITQLMKNIAQSKWLSHPVLSEISLVKSESGYKKSFRLALQAK